MEYKDVVKHIDTQKMSLMCTTIFISLTINFVNFN